MILEHYSEISFLVLLAGMFTSVAPNEVGIVFNPFKGGIQEDTLDQGLHFKSLFNDVTNIKTSNEIRHVVTDGQSKDGNSVTYNVTLTFNVETSNAGRFYRKSNVVNITGEQLNTIVKEGIQRVSSQYEVFDIIGPEVETVRILIFDEVEEMLNKQYHVTLNALTIEDVDAGADIEKALKRKAEANSEAQSILNSAAVNAINKMYLNQFEDDLSKKEDFETGAIGGYLSLVEISEVVIKQLYYDVWDGKLPTVVSGEDVGIIIQP